MVKQDDKVGRTTESIEIARIIWSALLDSTGHGCSTDGIGEIAAGSIDEKTRKDYSALCSITSDEVKSWSANRVLVVSNESDVDEDGALRLYETNVGESKCTEVLSRSLICLDLSGGNGVSSVLCDLDEHYVYVSYEDFEFMGGRGWNRVAVIDRNDFTVDLGDSVFPKWNFIDIRNSVIRYIRNCNDPSDPVIAFLKNGRTTKDLEFQGNPSIIPCGHGQFLLEVVLAAKDTMTQFETSDQSANYVSWKICLYSMSMHGIVWSHECRQFSYHYSPVQRSLASLRRPSQLNDGTEVTCNFAIWDHNSGNALVGDVYRDGTVKCFYTLLDAFVPGKSSFGDPRQEERIFLVVTSTDLVTTCDKGEYFVVSFYPKQPDGTISSESTELRMSDGLQLYHQPSLVRDHYVVLVCRDYYDNAFTIIAIHVPSRTKICDETLFEAEIVDEDFRFENIPRLVPDCQNTLGLCWPNVGLVMTGSDIRLPKCSSIEHCANEESKAIIQSVKRPATTDDSTNHKKRDTTETCEKVWE